MTKWYYGPACPDCDTAEHREVENWIPQHTVKEVTRVGGGRSISVNRQVEAHVDGYTCTRCGRSYAGIDVPADWVPPGHGPATD